MQAQLKPLQRFSPWAVRLAAAWVIGVSSIKMFGGSPNDIPVIVRENFPGGPEFSFFATISIELAFSLVALVHPRLGWILQAALMSVFVAVLLHLISIGATSCGCFGGAISLSPYAMLAIDGSLFALMLATRPWSSIQAERTPWLALGGVAIVGVAAPWILIHNEPVVRPVRETTPVASSHGPDDAPAPANGGAPSDTAQGERRTAADGNGGAEPTSAGETPAPVASGADSAAQAAPAGEWKLPPVLPRWARLRPPDWVGKSIHDTDLAIWMDTRMYPEDATWIVYLETCAHCRDYLRELAANFASDPKIYVFVRLSTPEDETAKQVDEMPPGETAALPAEVSWVVGPELPPWELVLEGGVVKSATHHGE